MVYFSLLLENWYALSDSCKIILNGMRQSTNSKCESESPRSIPHFMSNPPSMISYLQTKNAWFVHSSQPYQNTLQSRNVELYHMLSYNQSMRLLGFSFSFTPPELSICKKKIDQLSLYTFVCTPFVPVAKAFSFLNSHRFHLLIYLPTTSILKVSM